MAPIVTFALLAASLLGAMSAPVSHDAKVGIAALHTKYACFSTIDTEPFHHSACGDIEHSSSHAVVAISAARFGNSKHKSSTCGKYVKINRPDSESTHYKYKKLTDDAEEDEDDYDYTSKPDWKPESEPESEPESKPESKPTGHHTERNCRGRGTWFSDTRGSCEVDFSQEEVIIALSKAQWGEQRGPDYQCFKKVRVSVKGDPSNSVVARVVDTCPHHYCSYGQLGLSQVSFRNFAPILQGVFLECSFV
ncbi:hypothetical protein EC957_005005 [Mortierella hygrophila]|uniref:Uncharacterized protein n=1 Tax=Mortierella hygrophila TaxID=979708 RepID=A0A9P6FED4_9FUNG|nr:hypothetical protein EC957_005005 [Mortierella hygrophila]